MWERARHVKGRRGCDVSCAKEGSKCTTLAPSTISQLLEVELSCQQTGENTCLYSHHYRFTYMYIPLTEAIISHGGTLELVHILK